MKQDKIFQDERIEDRMVALLMTLLGWALLGLGGVCIGAAMARNASSVEIVGLKINIVISGFLSFIIGLFLVAFSTGMVTGN